MYMLASRTQSRLMVEDASQVGECRRAAQRLAEAWQFNDTLVGRIGIVATELANNLLKHAVRGELLIQAIQHGNEVSVELVTLDRGPGMQVDKCMQDGYSSAGTAGTGLGAISRLSTLFDVYSAQGQGTVAVSRIAKQPILGQPTALQRGPAPEFGSISIALAGESECGDTWRIAVEGNSLAILLADGLGHGPLAANAAQRAATAFGETPFDAPSQTLQKMHNALSGSRGAAAACAVWDRDNSRVVYSGVGNISGCVLSIERSKGMVSHNGILGVQLPRSQQFDYDCRPADRIVMHSDGLSARWSLNNYPGLSVRHAAVIAAVLYRDHRRARDDVTVVVVGNRP
jgi:anti-sigma regulatory factor (Ser/Thr protein kinase)